MDDKEIKKLIRDAESLRAELHMQKERTDRQLRSLTKQIDFLRQQNSSLEYRRKKRQNEVKHDTT